jgi:peptidoglycan hydrolase-like protein with peptidoglycan-binding domain
VRRRVAALAGVLVLAGATGAWALMRPAPVPPAVAAIATGTDQVIRTDVAQRGQVNGTLTYEGSYQVRGTGGTLTRLPALGAVITRGRALYEAAGRKVPLMYGSRPAWRTLSLGMTDGADVKQLETNLRALGYKGITVDRHFSLATYYAVRRWQDDANLPVTGSVPLGQVVFLPRSLRVTEHDAQLGAPAQGTVLRGTSAMPAVSVDLDPSMMSGVKVGDRVQVMLPDGETKNGRVSKVSPVATTTTGEAGESASTVPITIRLTGKAPRALDQTLVQVAITTQVHEDVLAVPIVALLARPGGEFALVVDGRQVPVEVGLFDETAGLVEVTGVSEGTTVEVPVQ